MHIQTRFSFLEYFCFPLCTSPAIISIPFPLSPFQVCLMGNTLFVVLVFNSVNTNLVVARRVLFACLSSFFFLVLQLLKRAQILFLPCFLTLWEQFHALWQCNVSLQLVLSLGWYLSCSQFLMLSFVFWVFTMLLFCFPSPVPCQVIPVKANVDP